MSMRLSFALSTPVLLEQEANSNLEFASGASDNVFPGLLDFGVGVAGVEGDAKENIFDCFYTVNT